MDEPVDESGRVWSYDPDRNAIHLQFVALPLPGTNATVKYTGSCLL